MMGAIADLTSSFNIPFVIGGFSFLISAALHFLLFRYDPPAAHGKSDVAITTTNNNR